MKGLFCILIVALTTVAVSAILLPETKKIIEDCKTESGINKGKANDLNDPKVQCFYACFYKKIGKMTEDGKMSAEKTIELYSKIHTIDESTKEILTNCSEEANKSEGCEVATVFIQCANNKFHKISKTTPAPVE